MKYPSLNHSSHSAHTSTSLSTLTSHTCTHQPLTCPPLRPQGAEPGQTHAGTQIAGLRVDTLSAVIANLDGALFEEIQNLTEQLVECKVLLAESQSQHLEMSRESSMLQQVNAQLSAKLQSAMHMVADLTTGAAGSSRGVAPAGEEEGAAGGEGQGAGAAGQSRGRTFSLAKILRKDRS
jgi:hypothetical protein